MQTSDRVSSIAAKYMNITATDVLRAGQAPTFERSQIAEDIRAMAASCLRQDEVKGKRRGGLMGLLYSGGKERG